MTRNTGSQWGRADPEEEDTEVGGLVEEVQAGALGWEQGWDCMGGWGGKTTSWPALTSEHTGLISGHLPGLAEVTLVAHKHDNDSGFGMVIELLQPALHHGVGLVLGQVKHQEGPHCTAIVPGKG